MEGLREPLELFKFRSRVHSLPPCGRQWILRELRLQDRDQRVAARGRRQREWRRVAPLPAGSTVRIIGANRNEQGIDNRTRAAVLVLLGLPTALILAGWIVGLPLLNQVILSFAISLVNATLLLQTYRKGLMLTASASYQKQSQWKTVYSRPQEPAVGRFPTPDRDREVWGRWA